MLEAVTHPYDVRVGVRAGALDQEERVQGRLGGVVEQDGTPEERLDVLHAWLVEDLPGGRVRILAQETQIGEPAAAPADERPNPMLNGHQAWLDGLVSAAAK
ncbi:MULTISPECIES: hypothetical protein [unclassified Streptomyces]|uniref:hypothetical protein n=1 Tax=unclassified Streptomyces TaxID=2593676 RepID=UPI0038652A0A